MIRCKLFGHTPIVAATRGQNELSTGFTLYVECRRCNTRINGSDPYGSGLPVLLTAQEADTLLFGKPLIQR